LAGRWNSASRNYRWISAIWVQLLRRSDCFFVARFSEQAIPHHCISTSNRKPGRSVHANYQGRSKLKNPFANPLVIKELREEMRSKKIFVLVPAYIAILSIVALVAVGSSGGASFNPLTLSSEARITLYSFIITITILLGLVSIVLGAASFTVEREK